MNEQTQNRTVIIGCDELSRLSVILSGLSQVGLSDLAVITVSRDFDLIKSIQNNKPVLVVLCFDTNQRVLTELSNSNISKSFPVFCFTLDPVNAPLWWSSDVNVFSYPYDRAVAEKSIARRVGALVSIIKREPAQRSHSFVPKYGNQVGVQNLSRFVLELDQKNAVLDRVKDEIQTISEFASDEVSTKLRVLLSMIKRTKSDQRYWTEFKAYFDEINPDFFKTLSRRHPTLTTKDLKYCSYLSMNLSNNEITRLMGINQESVRTHKYRLKKKMALSKEQNLEHYLIRVNSMTQKTA